MRLVLVFVLLLTPAASAFAQPRTADPVKRGFKESDFPRVVKLAENVYGCEDLRSAGDQRFTTVSLFVVTLDGVLIADGQGNPEATKKLVDAVAKVTPQPIKWVVVD